MGRAVDGGTVTNNERAADGEDGRGGGRRESNGQAADDGDGKAADDGDREGC